MDDQGTLLIDEVQNIPLEVQKQLLLVLQNRRVRPLGSTREVEVDVKVLAASNSPLSRAVGEGRFRRDLFMRLSPATRVEIPPLRQRPGDLPMLARHFTGKALEEPENGELADLIARAASLPPRTTISLVIGRRDPAARHPDSLRLVIPSPVWDLLRVHSWPGNVRELEMVMRNLVTFTLVEAADAIRAGLTLDSPRLQVNPGLVGTLLAGYASVPPGAGEDREHPAGENEFLVRLEPGETLNAVSNSVERGYFVELFRRTGGDFAAMAEILLGDSDKARAVRLRFNQLGLKVRELK